MTHWCQSKLDEVLTKQHMQITQQSIDGKDIPDPGPEKVLQAKCTEWLRNKNYKYIHVQGKKNDAGILDLYIFLPKAHVVVIELKDKTGRMSREQKLWVSYLLYHDYSVYPGVKSYKRFLEIMAKELANLEPNPAPNPNLKRKQND